MSSVKVEGIEECKEQFEQIFQEILDAANDASIEVMKPALASAKGTSRFKDKTGRLRRGLQLFFIKQIKQGKSRVWATLGVPHHLGLQYYIPLELGHGFFIGKKTPGLSKRAAWEEQQDRFTGVRAKPAEFLKEAYTRVRPGANEIIQAAIMRVLNKYGVSEVPNPKP